VIIANGFEHGNWHTAKTRLIITQEARKLVQIVVTEFNYLVKNRQQAGYFDYKSNLKSKDAVRKMTDENIKSYKVVLIRHPEDSFEHIITEDGKIDPKTLL